MINPQAVSIFVKHTLAKCPPLGQTNPGGIETDTQCVLIRRAACECPPGSPAPPLLSENHGLLQANGRGTAEGSHPGEQSPQMETAGFRL